MAVRRQIVRDLALFECELDCGTAALSGGDHYAFYRILTEGYSIVFNPDALVWHRDRRTLQEFERMLYGYSVGVYCYLLRCVLQHRDPGAVQVGLLWFLNHHLRELVRGVFKRSVVPLRYTLAEIRGALAAPAAYRKTRRLEARAVASAKWAESTPGNPS
jgi:hypothetical protein